MSSRNARNSRGAQISSLYLSKLSGVRFQASSVVNDGGGGGGGGEEKFAIVYTVGPEEYNDFKSIQEAVSAAAAENPTAETPIVIHVEPGDYYGFQISTDHIYVKGTGKESTRLTGLVWINTATTFEISDISISNVYTNTSFTVSDCLFTGKLTNIGAEKTINIFNTEFSETSEIQIASNTLVMKDCSGGLSINSVSAFPTIQMNNSTIKNLTISFPGVSQIGTTELSMTNCTITGGFVIIDIPTEPNITGKISGCTFANVEIHSGEFNFNTCLFTGVVSSFIIDNEFSGEFRFSDCTFEGGTVEFSGTDLERNVEISGSIFDEVIVGANINCVVNSCMQSVEGTGTIKRTDPTTKLAIHGGIFRDIQNNSTGSKKMTIASLHCDSISASESAYTIINDCSCNDIILTNGNTMAVYRSFVNTIDLRTLSNVVLTLFRNYTIGSTLVQVSPGNNNIVISAHFASFGDNLTAVSNASVTYVEHEPIGV